MSKSNQVSRLALPKGSVLGSYRLIDVLGEGGFGITYLADHTLLQRKVALKELLPTDIAIRDTQGHVVARNTKLDPEMDWACERFIAEAQNIAKCKHPNIVEVFDIFQANSTAYMAMGFEKGETLDTWLKDLGRAPTEAEVLSIAIPLLDGLSCVHANHLLHRDIKPENIYIRADGRPMLLDFGAAREAISSRSRPVTTLLTPGYAPYEQYASEDASHLGAWTDLYAFGAMLHRMIVGIKPVESSRRIHNDPYVPVSRSHNGQYPRNLLAAIDWCLSVREKDRPQTTAALRAKLTSQESSTTKRDTPPDEVPKVPGLKPAALLATLSMPWRIGLGAGGVGLLMLGGFSLGTFTTRKPTNESLAAVNPAPVTSPLDEPLTSRTKQPLTPAPLPTSETPTKNKPNPIPPPIEPAKATIPKTVPPPPPAPKRRTRGFDKKKSFTNSLGMEMLYAGTPNGYMSKQETRASDYQVFMVEQPDKAGQHTFADPKHPAHGISFSEAQAFCHWLTERERTSEMIGTEDAYDVPTDVEWTTAAMWPEKDKGMVYPWRGTTWPPVVMVGNFADQAATGSVPAIIKGYTDGFLGPSPVGSFAVPTPFGLDDLAGNVAEWSVLPGIDGPPGLRGGGWTDSNPKVFRSETIVSAPDGAARIDAGFRCVLRVSSSGETEQIAPAIVRDEAPTPAADDLERLKKAKLSLSPGWTQTPFNRLTSEQQEAQIDNTINNYFYGVNTGSNGALAEALTPTVILSGVDQTTGHPTANGLAAKDFIRHITEWLNKQGKPPQMITQPGAWKIIHRGNDNTIRVQLNFDVADLGKTMPTLHWSQTMIFDATSGKISGIADLVEAK